MLINWSIVRTKISRLYSEEKKNRGGMRVVVVVVFLFFVFFFFWGGRDIRGIWLYIMD